MSLQVGYLCQTCNSKNHFEVSRATWLINRQDPEMDKKGKR